MSAVVPPADSGVRAAYGDSIVRGVAASAIGVTNWVALLSRDLGGPPIVNHGADGSQVFDQADDVFDAIIGAGSVSTWMGVNDQHLYGASANRRAAFSAAHLAELAWLALPEERKIRGRSPAVERTGTWVDNHFIYGAALGSFSTTPGSTASASLYGRTVYVCTIQQVDNSSVVSVAVDGVGYGSFPTRTAVPPTRRQRSYGPALLRIAGLADGAHRVVLTV